MLAAGRFNIAFEVVDFDSHMKREEGVSCTMRYMGEAYLVQWRNVRPTDLY
jgi:hypothetical protein